MHEKNLIHILVLLLMLEAEEHSVEVWALTQTSGGVKLHTFIYDLCAFGQFSLPL